MEIETVQLWAFGKVNYNNYQLISIVLFVSETHILKPWDLWHLTI
jgi:hypothetical protein